MIVSEKLRACGAVRDGWKRECKLELNKCSKFCRVHFNGPIFAKYEPINYIFHLALVYNLTNRYVNDAKKNQNAIDTKNRKYSLTRTLSQPCKLGRECSSIAHIRR